jgi:hypothetical protein
VRPLLVLALVLGLAATARADTVTQTADSGPIHAAFTFDRVQHRDYSEYRNLQLQVTDAGTPVVTDRIPDGWQPGGFDRQPSVSASDLDGDGKAEVLLDLYSGGAHCCYATRIYDGAHIVRHTWGDPSYDLVQRNGLTWFRTGDDTFAYAFSAYAFSLLPLQVWRYDGTRLVDTTRAVAWWPDLRRQASRLRADYRAARRHYRELVHQQTLRSALAAYAADECSLGHCDRGLALARNAVARGEVRMKGFLRDLRALLARDGYTR